MLSILFYVLCFPFVGTYVFLWYRTLELYDHALALPLRVMLTLCYRTSRKWILVSLLAAVILLHLLLYLPMITGVALPDEYVFYALLVTFGTISWNMLPPAVLFLASSRAESAEIAKATREHLARFGLRLSYLLEPTIVPSTHRMGFFVNNFRTTRSSRWEESVQSLMRMVPIVLIDTRIASTGVIREVGFNLENRLYGKTIFIVEPDASSEVLNGFRSSTVVSLPVARNESEVADRLTWLITRQRLQSRLRNFRP